MRIRRLIAAKSACGHGIAGVASDGELSRRLNICQLLADRPNGCRSTSDNLDG